MKESKRTQSAKSELPHTIRGAVILRIQREILAKTCSGLSQPVCFVRLREKIGDIRS